MPRRLPDVTTSLATARAIYDRDARVFITCDACGESGDFGYPTGYCPCCDSERLTYDRDDELAGGA